MKTYTKEDILIGAMFVLLFGYAGIGMLHMVFLSFTVTNAQCLSAKTGFVYWFCSMPREWAHAILGLLWPLYWMQ